MFTLLKIPGHRHQKLLHLTRGGLRIQLSVGKGGTQGVSNGKPLEFGGEWTRQKLDVVGRYLASYVSVMRKQPFRLVYIDAFAGTGYCGRKASGETQVPLFPDLADAEAQGFLKGSTRRSLEVEPRFDEYVFIDRDRDKCAELGRLVEEYPDRADRIRLVTADANDYLQDMCGCWPRGQRAVLFLDPYGMEVQWSTVQAVARTQSFDMWYLFPLSGVNRLLRRDAQIGPVERALLNRLFGSSEWEQEFYREDDEPSLFDDAPASEKVATLGGIQRFLMERLAREFAQVVPNPGILRNSRNSPLFLLCFAAANPRGASIAVRIAKHLLRDIQ